MQITLPAEWSHQSGVMVTWPHEDTDWLEYLGEAENIYKNITREISAVESVLIVYRNQDHLEHIRSLLNTTACNLDHILFFQADSNDTWARDFGPITVFRDGNPCILDYTFNGWGNKFLADKDNHITKTLHKNGAFTDIERKEKTFVLEGGSIESDGEGTILTTSQCLLNPNRNPGLTRHEIEQELVAELGSQRILWLNHGYLAGDDTDSHIDTLARFCNLETIAYMSCDDPADEHFTELSHMETELKSFKTGKNKPYRLVPLPLPEAIFDDKGHRLPATYANFLIINGSVLVPTYRQPEKDQQALGLLSKAFPYHRITGIDCLPLIYQHGSLHCITMQIPEGVLNHNPYPR